MGYTDSHSNVFKRNLTGKTVESAPLKTGQTDHPKTV